MLKVLITGGTGSLGHALVERLSGVSWVSQCTVYSRDEVKQSEMRASYPGCRYVLGDVRDESWLRLAMMGHDMVVHAAAYKQVPAAESNTAEAIETNVWGSRNVARAALMAGVKRVVGISTDKACAPINTYGQSKALMEKLFSQACLWGDTQFNCVRYGNVIGSRGSVVPLFRRQALEGLITLTDPAMTRFWMTLGEAVDLVLFGLAEPERGTVVVPKCPASSMEVMARAVIAEAGVKGVRVNIVGARPGEKQHEQLLHRSEAMHTDELAPAHFRVWPAYLGRAGGLPFGYEYRSDTAPQLSVEELGGMLNG